MIAYTCSACGRFYQVREKSAGKLFRCKACGQQGRIESPAAGGLLRDFDSLFMAKDIYYMKVLVR